MCIGIPGQILEIYTKNNFQMGKIDFGGITKEVCLAYVPEANPGEYVLVHAGFAISLMNQDEAAETLHLLQEVTDIDQMGNE